MSKGTLLVLYLVILVILIPLFMLCSDVGLLSDGLGAGLILVTSGLFMFVLAVIDWDTEFNLRGRRPYYHLSNGTILIALGVLSVFGVADSSHQSHDSETARTWWDPDEIPQDAPAAVTDDEWGAAVQTPSTEAYARADELAVVDMSATLTWPASAFKRAQPKESAAATSGSNADSSGTEPATKAQRGALRAVDGGKQTPAADVAAATKLVAAGWRYVMPAPKSKAAKWGNKDTRTTWWPGYWKNASGATSVAQPAEADKFAGDGAAKPAWKDGGSPKTPTWVEWLCSESGGVMPE